MTFIFIKIFVIFVLTFSVLSDFSALADIEETNNSGSDQNAAIAKVFPDITTGEAQYNTAHGYHAAGMDITTGDANTVVGYESGKNINTGSYNTAFGSESLNNLVSGSKNTAVGYRAGYDNTTGSGNVFIGNEAGATSGNVSNKLYIGNSSGSTPLIYGDFTNKIVTINDNLTVADDLTVAGDATVTGSISTSSGTISTQSGNITTNSGNITTSSGNISATGAGSTLTIGSTTLNSTELGYIDNITAGTVLASKAVVVDSNKDITGFRNITATGTIKADTIQANTIKDSNGDNFLYKDTINDVVHIGSNSMLFYDSSTYGKDIMASSTGQIQIGNSLSDTTTVMGDLIIQEPTAANHASTRRYADKVSLMAASLDTKLPLYGNKHALTLSGASTNNETAFGINFVGIYDGLHLPMDISLGSAFSGEYSMGKLSLGFSW